MKLVYMELRPGSAMRSGKNEGSHRNTLRKGSRGITLLEMMLALTLLGLTLIPLLTYMANYVGQVQQLKTRNKALFLAQKTMESAITANFENLEEREGVQYIEEEKYPRFKKKIEVSGIGWTDTNLKWKEILVKISWKKGKHDLKIRARCFSN